MKEIVTEKHYQEAGRLRDLLATYQTNEDLINIGAYKGGNPAIDTAIRLIDPLNGFLKQGVNEHVLYKDAISQMEVIK